METIVAAIIGTVGGLFAGIFVSWLSTRLREPNPHLAFVFQSTPAITARALGRLRRRIQITYEATPVKSLHVCSAAFRNTGNQILTSVRLSFVVPEQGKLFRPEVDIPQGVQLGKYRLRPGGNSQSFQCDLDHVLSRDRFSVTFLAADTDPGEVKISVEKPPCRLKQVGRLETPAEQVREAFRTDPARFSLQLLLPLLAAAAGTAAAVLTAFVGE